MYRKQAKTFKNYERIFKFYYSNILAFHNFYLIHTREFMFKSKGR